MRREVFLTLALPPGLGRVIRSATCRIDSGELHARRESRRHGRLPLSNCTAHVLIRSDLLA